MINDQIISTLRFFDLQNLPLTLFEIDKFLIGKEKRKPQDILETLEVLVREGKVKQFLGFYCLPEREELVKRRLRNYLYALPREKLIKRYAKSFRHLPFIRGVALAGSQALGDNRPESDIDLLVITDLRFLWTARIFITGYLQILGLRRYGSHIANRFCLNHYVAGPKQLAESRNLYTAMEYLKLRPLIFSQMVRRFQDANLEWIENLFPNAAEHLIDPVPESRSIIQMVLEGLLRNPFGRFLEDRLGDWQFKRINLGKDILVRKDELSFHPNSQQSTLLSAFEK